MPRIPVYEQQVAPANMPGVRTGTNYSAEAFGGNIAKGVGMVSDELDKVVTTGISIQEKIQKKKDAIWVQERLSKLAQQYDTYSYGSPDGKVAGVLTSKGLAAADAAKNAPEALEKFYSDLSAESPSHDALLEFQTRAISIKSSASSTIARHAATELNRYHAEAAMGNANVQSELSARDYNQAPEALKEAFDTRVAPSIKEAARLTGTPVEEALMAARSTFYEQVISQNLAAGDTKRASALLAREDWNDALDAKTRSTLTEKIRRRPSRRSRWPRPRSWWKAA